METWERRPLHMAHAYNGALAKSMSRKEEKLYWEWCVGISPERQQAWDEEMEAITQRAARKGAQRGRYDDAITEVLIGVGPVLMFAGAIHEWRLIPAAAVVFGLIYGSSLISRRADKRSTPRDRSTQRDIDGNQWH